MYNSEHMEQNLLPIFLFSYSSSHVSNKSSFFNDELKIYVDVSKNNFRLKITFLTNYVTNLRHNAPV